MACLWGRGRRAVVGASSRCVQRASRAVVRRASVGSVRRRVTNGREEWWEASLVGSRGVARGPIEASIAAEAGQPQNQWLPARIQLPARRSVTCVRHQSQRDFTRAISLRAAR